MLQQNLFDNLEWGESTSSPQVSRANPSQLQEAVKAMVTSVISGRRSLGSFARLGPDSSWEKTFGGFSLFPTDEFSVPFLETWATWGTGWGGVASELMKPQDIRIVATESSSLDTWPTAQAWDAKGYHDANPDPVKTPEQQKARGGGCANLAEHAATWATPRAGKTSSEDLEVWANTNFRPDPETSEHGESSSPESPTSRRHSPPKKQLNWEFVRALMGFPEGWL
jgi:hypothetical protein